MMNDKMVDTKPDELTTKEFADELFYKVFHPAIDSFNAMVTKAGEECEDLGVNMNAVMSLCAGLMQASFKAGLADEKDPLESKMQNIMFSLGYNYITSKLEKERNA